MNKILADLRSYISRRVREGFDSPERITEDTLDYAHDEHGRDDLDEEVERLTAEVLAEHRQTQAGWDAVTDCDRLDAAFAALEERGIVARQNFTCCSNCGHSEIWGEIRQADVEREVKGYVFYHMQDTESVAEYGDMYLKYGAVEEGEDAAVKVGRTITCELKKAGLTVGWNGKSNTAIHVTGLDWKRRR
jgi:hypothetical protein